MGLFKDVKKPVIRQAARATADISPLRPRQAIKQPPCTDRCPLGIDVRGWLAEVAQAEAYGRTTAEGIQRAWAVLADVNPFPATLGRICPAPCEKGCHRAGKDGAVPVNALERTLGDVAIAREFALPAATPAARAGKVAVVGAGPAGLSCAYQLARRGHRVTVIEAAERPGGRLRDAIRTGRLAPRVVDAEIVRVVALGVTVEQARVDASDVDGLTAEYDAVFLAGGRAAAAAFVVNEDGRTSHPKVFAGGDMVRPGLVGAALANGRRAAETIDAIIGSRAEGTREAAPAVIAVSRVKLDWYPQAEPGDWTRRVEPDIDRAASERAALALLAEARRCLSCGACMDCDRCWMFCTNNCFEKLPKGQHYRVNVDTCNGCRKCADECPCGYLDML